MSKKPKSVGDVWVLCRKSVSLSVFVTERFKIKATPFEVKGGVYLHLSAKELPKALLEKINDPAFREEHGIVQIHFEQPIGVPRPVGGL